MSQENPFAELEQVVPKNKLWFVVVEKIVATLLCLIGVVMIFALTTDTGGNWGAYRENYGLFNGMKLFVKDNGYVFLLTIIALCSGVFLALKRKEGWVGAIAFITHVGVILGLSFLMPATIDIENDSSDIVIYILILLLLALIVVVLMQKQAQIRYKLTRKDYYFPAGLFLLLYVARYLTLGQFF